LLANFIHFNLRRVEIHLVGPTDCCTDVRAAMSGTANPET
jgi:hypothetical protein